MTLADDLAALQRPIVAGTARILVLDIERLPALAWVWEPKTRYVSPRQFQSWPRMICFAYQWYDDGPDNIRFAAEWHKGGHEGMVAKAHQLYSQADVVVGFNSIRFDNKHLRTEWLEAGMDPPPPWRDVDLYKVVGQLGMESKSLDTVTRRLGLTGKVSHYSIDQALAAVNGDRQSRRELKSYNEADVALTRRLYDRLRPWIKNHPHVGTWGDAARCSACGSDDLAPIKKRYRPGVLEYGLRKCNACGANVRTSWEARQSSSRNV